MDSSNIAGSSASDAVPAHLDEMSARAESALDQALSETPVETPQEESHVPSVGAFTDPTRAVPAAPGSTPAPAGLDLSSLTPEAQNWLNKYGGDVNAAAAAAWNNSRNLSAADQLAQRIERLERERAEGRESTPQPEMPQPTFPEIQQLDSRMRELDGEWNSLDSSYAQVKTNQQALMGQIEDLEERHSDLTRQLLRATIDTDETAIKADLRKVDGDLGKAKSRLGSANAKADQIMARAQQIRTAASDLQLHRQRAEESIHLRMTREAETYARKQEAVSSFRSGFDSTVQAAAKQLGVPDKLSSKFSRWAHAQALYYLQTPGPNGEKQVIEDVPAFVSALGREYMADVDEYHRAKSALYSEQKTRDATVNSPDARRSAAAPDTRKRSPQEWDEFHENFAL